MSDPATLTSAVSPSVEEGPVADPLGHPTDTFDVEPPYLPDAEAIAGVEKFDDRFIDREISWVRFNQRVLELAEDPGLPLLERARFLAIFASNLDEFFMVRVAGLKRRIAAGVAVRAASGMMPREQLEKLWVESRGLMERHARALIDLLPELGGHGIEILRWSELDREEQKICKKLFRDRIFPVLTPLAVDPPPPQPQKNRG
jgi:polyphosphate kinase